jgi:hypothetical protein
MFTQFSAGMLWPGAMNEIGQQICDALDPGEPQREIVPFFSHGTGDYDCL